MKDLQTLKNELANVEYQIKMKTPNDSYLDNVSRSFHLGMVGGSGRNTYRLNKRREASLDRTIKAAVILCPLYRLRDGLIKQIGDIESGRAAKKELSIIDIRLKRVEMWKNLKAGDELPIGNSNGNPIIKTKNAKSVITTSGTKWTVSEIIGREAAHLL
jgi:hypothetical protein